MNRNTKIILHSALFFFLVAVLLAGIPLFTYAADVTDYPGAADSGLGISYSISNSRGSGSATTSSTDLVCTSTGYRYGGNKSTTLTVTFTNNSGVEKRLSFTVSKNDTNGTLKVNNTQQDEASKAYSVRLANGASYTVTLASPAGAGNSSTVTISGIELAGTPAGPVNVTFLEAEKDALGNSTGSCSQTGKTVAYEGDISGLTVTPAAGYVFLYWKNADDGTIVSETASGFAKPFEELRVIPHFVPKDTARFTVDGSTYYYWEDAFVAAKAGGKKVIVSTNGILPGGKAFNKLGFYVTADANGNITYNVPSDCYLVVPRHSTDTGTFGSEGNFQNGDGTTTPKVFRTFTVQSGAKIVCDGKLNVNGQRRERSQGHVGQTMGDYGRIVLQGSDTQLLVNGTLYCYGYISGTGMVEVNGTIHELLEMGCWNGGSNALAWKNAAGQDAIFMISQYFIQNVEAPLKINGGATEKLETVVSVNMLVQIDVRKASTFIAPSDGLFQLPTGAYLLREHDLENDRVTYTLGSSDGTAKTVNFGSITIEAKALSIGATISSSSYTLPIPNNMTMKVGDKVTINMGNRVAILPGAGIIIDEGATVNMTNHLYIFGYNDWKHDMYYKASGTAYCQAAYYNTTRGTTSKLIVNTSGLLQVDGTLHLSGNGGLYTTGTAADTANYDKVVQGEGTIIHEGAQAAGSLKAGFTGTLTTIKVTNGMARLAGITDPTDLTTYAEMGISTYYGLGDAYNHFWYETKEEQAATCTQDGGTTYNVTGGSGLYIKTAALGHNYNSETTDATCTEDGSTVHTCSACGDTYTEVIVALGHNYISVTIDATCTADGMCTCTCSACGDSYTEVIAALGHADKMNANDEEISDHFCDHCNLIMYYATNVRLGNSLDMMFAFPKVFTDEPDTYYIKLVRTYANGTTSEQIFSYANNQWSVTTDFIYITYTGLSAKEMCDKIEVTIYNSQHEAVSVTWVDSIRDYAMRLLDKHEDEKVLLRTLLVDMLNYGAACQDYFDYGKDDPANALLSDTQIAYASTAKEYTATNENRPGWQVSQLVVESNILYNIVFANTLTYNGQSLDTADLYVRYSYVGHKGNRETISNLEKISDMATVVIDGVTYHYIAVKGMVVADAAKTADDNGTDFAITITITDLGGSTVYAEWTDSIKDYTARNTETHDVYGLFMQFAESAYTYLHTEEARIP